MEEDTLPLVRFESEALYAAYSINSSLHTYLSRNAEDAVRAAHSNYDILGSYFFETSCDRNREQSRTNMQDVHTQLREEQSRFKAHPLVQAELNRQRDDITKLDAASATGSVTFITSFREVSTNAAILPSDILYNTNLHGP